MNTSAALIANGCGTRIRLRTIALLAAISSILAVDAALLAPHLAGARAQLADARWAWIIVAVLAEAASMIALARLQFGMLRDRFHVGLRRGLAATLAGNAMAATLPGGSVASAGHVFARMRLWGADAGLASFALLFSAAISTMTLTLLTLPALAFQSGTGVQVDALAAAGVLTVAATIGALRLRHHPILLIEFGTRVLRFANAGMRRPSDSGRDAWIRAVTDAVAITPTTGQISRAIGAATINWVADIVCLIAAARAVGADELGVTAVIVAYAIAMVAASVPFLPGGIGVVDGALTVGLHEAGVPLARAAAAAVIYRVISLVLVVALGWTVWLRQRGVRVGVVSREPTTASNVPRAPRSTPALHGMCVRRRRGPEPDHLRFPESGRPGLQPVRRRTFTYEPRFAHHIRAP